MKVTEFDLPGLKLIEPRRFGDARGWFAEVWQADRYREAGGEKVEKYVTGEFLTHVVYGGNRADEFEQRLAGASYQDIAAAGGGNDSTTRTAGNVAVIDTHRLDLEVTGKLQPLGSVIRHDIPLRGAGAPCRPETGHPCVAIPAPGPRHPPAGHSA